jgi:hypothetical protein
MNDDQAFERAARALLDDGPDTTPPATIEAVLLAVRTTPQERDLRIPWRTTPMSNPMRLVAAFAIIVVAGVAAISLFGRSPGVGGGGTSSPSPSIARSSPAPSSPAPSSSAAAASPQPSPYVIDPATWKSYTSTVYRFSIGYPADWNVSPATRAWRFPADATVYGPRNLGSENFVSADSSIAAAAWSVAVTPGTTLAAWLQTYCPVAEITTTCTGIPALTVAATMDGHAGSLVSFVDDTQAFFLVQGRIYVVAIWRSAGFIPGGVPRLLEAYLSTMHLLPGGPTPTATTPRPS